MIPYLGPDSIVVWCSGMLTRRQCHATTHPLPVCGDSVLPLVAGLYALLFPCGCAALLCSLLARPLCSCQGAQLATQSSTLPSRGAKGDRRRHRSQRFWKGAELHRKIPMRPWVSAIVSETRGGAPPSSSRPRRTPHSSTQHRRWGTSQVKNMVSTTVHSLS